MDTIEWMLLRFADCKRTVTKTKGGWMLSYSHELQQYPITISFMEKGQEFLIMLPIGNKVHEEFFSPDDQDRLREFIKQELRYDQVG